MGKDSYGRLSKGLVAGAAPLRTSRARPWRMDNRADQDSATTRLYGGDDARPACPGRHERAKRGVGRPASCPTWECRRSSSGGNATECFPTPKGKKRPPTSDKASSSYSLTVGTSPTSSNPSDSYRPSESSLAINLAKSAQTPLFTELPRRGVFSETRMLARGKQSAIQGEVCLHACPPTRR